jgi:hypothetical protein
MGETNDTRTCAVCGSPVADALRGFLDSILACEEHLREWNASPARLCAAIASVKHGVGMSGAFDKWADKVRDADGR